MATVDAVPLTNSSSISAVEKRNRRRQAQNTRPMPFTIKKSPQR